MRALMIILCLGGVAGAEPTRPSAPGSPPNARDADHGEVVLVTHASVTSMSIFFTGHDDWKLTGTADKNELTIALRGALVVGTQSGKDAVLTIDGKPRKGAWSLELTAVSIGYLKRPGICSGKLVASFEKETFVTGTFEAGCLSYRNGPRAD